MPKKTVQSKTIKKIKDDCRILKENNYNEKSVGDDLSEDNIKSTFNTPTSSNLASCVGSPFYNKNEILVDISNVQEILQDIENISPNRDDSYTNRNDLSKMNNSGALIEYVEPQNTDDLMKPVTQNINDPEAEIMVTEPIEIEITGQQASNNADVIFGVPKLSELALLKLQSSNYNGSLAGMFYK